MSTVKGQAVHIIAFFSACPDHQLSSPIWRAHAMTIREDVLPCLYIR